MKFATVRTGQQTQTVVSHEGTFRLLPYANVGAALASTLLTDLDVSSFAEVEEPSAQDFAPLLPTAAKILCVGHNYGAHISEMGHEPPEYPNVFCKYDSSLVGAYDDVRLDAAAELWDWEAELAVVVGTKLHHADESEARDAIAGYTVANDVSARDWQRRASQWLLGKTFDLTTPLGPWLVTPDEVAHANDLRLTCSVNGKAKQEARTSDLVFKPVPLLAYLSTVMTLNPGDVVLTGTPGGVGAARKPPEWLTPGDVLETSIEGLGTCRNVCVDAATKN